MAVLPHLQDLGLAVRQLCLIRRFASAIKVLYREGMSGITLEATTRQSRTA